MKTLILILALAGAGAFAAIGTATRTGAAKPGTVRPAAAKPTTIGPTQLQPAQAADSRGWFYVHRHPSGVELVGGWMPGYAPTAPAQPGPLLPPMEWGVNPTTGLPMLVQGVVRDGKGHPWAIRRGETLPPGLPRHFYGLP